MVSVTAMLAVVWARAASGQAAAVARVKVRVVAHKDKRFMNHSHEIPLHCQTCVKNNGTANKPVSHNLFIQHPRHLPLLTNRIKKSGRKN
jgi:hypothetical protein